jgi:hypothetical protein
MMGFGQKRAQTARQRLHKAGADHRRTCLASWLGWSSKLCQDLPTKIGERIPAYWIQACGARNRKGQPCQVKTLYRNGRCKFHGGLSTGPKTKEGKAKALANLRRGKRPMHL